MKPLICLDRNLVLLGSHLLNLASNVVTYSTENLQYDEQVDELSSYLHDRFCLIPHQLIRRRFRLSESCKFRFPLATLECFLLLLFQVLVIVQLEKYDGLLRKFLDL